MRLTHLTTFNFQSKRNTEGGETKKLFKSYLYNKDNYLLKYQPLTCDLNTLKETIGYLLLNNCHMFT